MITVTRVDRLLRYLELTGKRDLVSTTQIISHTDPVTISIGGFENASLKKNRTLWRFGSHTAGNYHEDPAFAEILAYGAGPSTQA